MEEVLQENRTGIESRRELWLDALRGLGILLVCVGHTAPPLAKFVYGFHIPLFFILSGFLFKPDRFSVVKYLKRLILPYFILCGINLVIYGVICLGSGEHYDLPKYIIGILYSNGTLEWMPNCSPLWYLTCAFVTFFIFAALFKVKVKWFALLGAVTGCGISYVLYLAGAPKLPWNIDSAMMALIFVYAGYEMRRRDIVGYLLRRPVFVVLLIVCGSAAIVFNPVAKIDFDYNCYGNLFLMLTGALMVPVALFAIFRIVSWDKPVLRIMCWFGKHTILFMGFDYFAGFVARSIITWLPVKGWPVALILKICLLSLIAFVWEKLPFKRIYHGR